MEVHTVTVDLGDRKSFRLTALGDIQYGTQDCDVPRLRQAVREASRAGSFFIGMGDYTDLMSPSNRARLREAALYDSAVEQIDDMARATVEELAEILRPTRGRWLGFLQGHHFMAFADGTTSDTVLADLMEAPFLGDCALIVMQFQGTPVRVYAHHGAGYGQSVGSPLLRLQQAVLAADADLYLMAHQHRLVAGKPARLYWDPERGLRARELVLACTGSFMRGYREGRTGPSGLPEGSYVEKRMLPPVSLGCATFDIAIEDGLPRIRAII